MNYSNDLWNNYDLVYNRFQARIKEIKDISKLMTMKYESELEYAKGMKKISETTTNLLDDCSLAKGINVLKSDLSNQYTYISEFLQCLKGEIIEPLKNFTSIQTTFGQRLNDEMKVHEKSYKAAIEKTEKLRKNYHSLAKTADELKVKFDQAKANSNITAEQKGKLGIKYDAAFNEQKDAEVSYTHQLSFTNNLRNNYIEVIKNILNEFQNLEENYIDFVKDILRKYNMYQVPLSRNVQYDIERKGKIIESIERKSDILTFIQKYATPYSFPEKIKFQPYISPNSKTEVKTESRTNDELDENICKDITEVLTNAWKEKFVNKEKKESFLKNMKEKKYRKHFFNSLNHYRINNIFVISEQAFAILGDLLLSVIDELIIHKDYENFKYCLILSQTYYKDSANDFTNCKVYLQSAIEVNNIFRDLNFWEEMIKYSINEEFNHQNISAKNEEEQLKQNLNYMIMGQLISFSFQIMMFDITKEKTKILIEKFINFHSLSIEQKEQLLKHIDNYSKEVPIVINKNIDGGKEGSVSKSEIEEEGIDVIIMQNN